MEDCSGQELLLVGAMDEAAHFQKQGQFRFQ